MTYSSNGKSSKDIKKLIQTYKLHSEENEIKSIDYLIRNCFLIVS